MTFVLDPRLDRDSVFVADLDLCQVRLQDDSRWPWLVLIPRVADAVELTDLTPSQRARLMEEVVLASDAVRAMGATLGRLPEKINVGALGNVVAQLHVHVIGRRRDDPAGAAPVWGVGTAEPYAQALDLAIGAAQTGLGVNVEIGLEAETAEG